MKHRIDSGAQPRLFGELDEQSERPVIEKIFRIIQKDAGSFRRHPLAGSAKRGACRRLAKLMRELDWTPIKARGLNQRGLREQIRGYARDKGKLTVM